MDDKKTKLENNLDELFDLPSDTPSIVQSKEASKPPMPPRQRLETDHTRDIDSDYNYARENLYEIIENGSNALNDLVEIAKASEHPRAFEVVSTLMKTLTEANKDLLEIQTMISARKLCFHLRMRHQTRKPPSALVSLNLTTARSNI